MQGALTNFERYFLSLAVPSLALPELTHPSDVDLWEKAALIGYGDPEFCKRGEGNLRALCMVLGVLPSTYEERLAVISG